VVLVGPSADRRASVLPAMEWGDQVLRLAELLRASIWVMSIRSN
jgi:hypothetical protein